LLLPDDKVLLERVAVLHEIERKFTESDKKIKHMVIIGMAGSGKTTLVRNYAIKQNNNISWEINAENETEMFKSFECLALLLSKTKEAKQDLDQLYKTQNADLFRTKLISMIQFHLCKNPGWLLIYDNVKDIGNIIQHLPRNSSIWGKGKVIITTKNYSAVNNKYIDKNSVFYVPELSVTERKELFLKICVPDNKVIDSDVSYAHLNEFLHKIPPLPLDITTAAYFIKNTKMGYDEYVDELDNYNPSFRHIQENILKNTDNTFKTRYEIVINTVQEIIKNNIIFKNKLLEISFLNYNSIPVEL